MIWSDKSEKWLTNDIGDTLAATLWYLSGSVSSINEELTSQHSVQRQYINEIDSYVEQF